MRKSSLGWGAALGLCLGCTTLGPMSATTGVSAVPAGRPSVQGQLAALPGYYLSSAVQEDPKGAAIEQALLTFEPDRWLSVPGLFVGARSVGNDESGSYGEPMVGYRAHLDDARQWSLGGIAYGTYTRESRAGASYSAARGGGEVAADFNIFGPSRAAEIHLLASASLTELDLNGTYCIDAGSHYGIDCPEDPNARPLVSARASGLFPALVGGVALDFARGIPVIFHGLRVAGYLGGGTMPSVIGARQVSARSYSSFGVSIEVGFGARE